MKKTFLLSIVTSVLILSCAGRSPHVQWAPDLSTGLGTAASLDKPTIIEFTSPT